VKRLEESCAGQIVTCDSCQKPFTVRQALSPATRVTLTVGQLKHAKVEEFAHLLISIASDGVITYEEVQALAEWLNENKTLEPPAIRFMFDLLVNICNDGELSSEDICDIQLAIERVLPKTFREKIKEKRKEVYYNGPASSEQIELIERLTKKPATLMSRREASEFIERSFNQPSNRQLMLLRFWNRMDLADKTRSEVSEWIDEFTQDNQERWEAWSLFKDEIEDDGGQNDPSIVPIGAGERYLRKVMQ